MERGIGGGLGSRLGSWSRYAVTLCRRREARLVGRLLAATVVSALLTLPLALGWAINRAEVRELVGITPTTLSLTTSGHSELRLGVPGTVYLPMARGPFGVVATAEGPGDPDVGNGDLASYVTPEMLRLYAGLFHDPEPALSAYVDQLVAEVRHQLLLAVLTLAGLGGLTLFGLSVLLPRVIPSGRAGYLRAAAAFGLVLVTTSAVAVVQVRPLSADVPPDSRVYPLPALDGTPVEGSTTNSPVLRALLGTSLPKIQALISRQNESEQEFREIATAALTARAGDLAGPRPGETAVLLQSDMHCNTAMTRLQRQVAEMLGEQFGPDVPSLLAISGDLTTNGTAAEGTCIEDLVAIAGERPVAAVTGNHESVVSRRQMADAGMLVLDGSATEAGGVTLLGDDDPARSELFGPTRLRGDRTQADVGADLYDEALRGRVDVVLVHEAYAAAAFVGVDDMRSFLDGRGSADTPEEDGVRDLPAGAVFYGHWHRDVQPRVVWNSDGTWTLVMELNTSGGAIARPTLGRFSTPWSRPQQVASFPVVFLDEETRLVTGYQLYRFEPDGTVSVLPRVDIGTLGTSFNPQP